MFKPQPQAVKGGHAFDGKLLATYPASLVLSRRDIRQIKEQLQTLQKRHGLLDQYLWFEDLKEYPHERLVVINNLSEETKADLRKEGWTEEEIEARNYAEVHLHRAAHEC